MASSDPWWVVKAFASSVPVYQVVQGPPPGPNPHLVQTANGTTAVVTGPFPTQAAAEATIPKGAARGPGGPNGPNNTNPSPATNVPQAFSDIQTALAAFYDKVTDGKMWRSLGWLVGGVLIAGAGIALWIGPEALKKSPEGVLARGALRATRATAGEAVSGVSGAPGAAPLIPVIMTGIGLYLAWFGVHYWDSDTRWPTDPIKAVLQGKPIPQPSGQTPASAVAAQVQSQAAAVQPAGSAGGSQPGSSGTPGGLNAGISAPGNPPPTGTVARNQAAAKIFAISMGHSSWTTGQQWQDWVSLWERESSWGLNNQNPTSTAYGIAQFLDSTWVTVGCVKTSNVDIQIQCGIKYIASRYGNPSSAWAHEVANGWY